MGVSEKSTAHYQGQGSPTTTTTPTASQARLCSASSLLPTPCPSHSGLVSDYHPGSPPACHPHPIRLSPPPTRPLPSRKPGPWCLKCWGPTINKGIESLVSHELFLQAPPKEDACPQALSRDTSQAIAAGKETTFPNTVGATDARTGIAGPGTCWNSDSRAPPSV